VLQMPIAMPFALPLERTVAAWMIAGSRVTGLLVVAPFFGSAAVPLASKWTRFSAHRVHGAAGSRALRPRFPRPRSS